MYQHQHTKNPNTTLKILPQCLNIQFIFVLTYLKLRLKYTEKIQTLKKSIKVLLNSKYMFNI